MYFFLTAVVWGRELEGRASGWGQIMTAADTDVQETHFKGAHPPKILLLPKDIFCFVLTLTNQTN